MAQQPSSPEEAPVLVVGLSNPRKMDRMMRLALAIARVGGHQVLATHVVTVPPQAHLGTARSSPEIARARRLLTDATRLASEENVRARAVVQVARTVSDGLISAAANHNADLMLVGFSEEAGAPARGEKTFDRIMHRVARARRSDLIVAKFRREETGDVLVPLSTGENLRVSGLLVRAVAADEDTRVTFLHIIGPDDDEDAARRHMGEILAHHDLADVGEVNIARAEDSIAAMVARANDFDLAIVGSERPRTLKESIFGTWAERVANEAECSVLLVRTRD